MKAVPSCPGYFADIEGNIWRNGSIIKSRSNGHGYLRITVSLDNVQTDKYVHRLVCEAYHGPCPPEMMCRHLDGVRSHNVPENLQWSDRATNEADKHLHGTLLFGEAAPWAKFSTARVMEARARVRQGETLRSIAADWGVSAVILGEIVAGKRWKHLPGAVSAMQNRRHLSEADVRAVRLLAGAMSREKIAERYGVTRTSIDQIVNGISYKHVR